jgi:methionyl-tRNA formyltransferase
LKIAIIGSKGLRKAVLEGVFSRGATRGRAFSSRHEKEGAKADPMKVAAQEKGLKVFQFPRRSRVPKRRRR